MEMMMAIFRYVNKIYILMLLSHSDINERHITKSITKSHILTTKKPSPYISHYPKQHGVPLRATWDQIKVCVRSHTHHNLYESETTSLSLHDLEFGTQKYTTQTFPEKYGEFHKFRCDKSRVNWKENLFCVIIT